MVRVLTSPNEIRLNSSIMLYRIIPSDPVDCLEATDNSGVMRTVVPASAVHEQAEKEIVRSNVRSLVYSTKPPSGKAGWGTGGREPFAQCNRGGVRGDRFTDRCDWARSFAVEVRGVFRKEQSRRFQAVFAGGRARRRDTFQPRSISFNMSISKLSD
jgi:hypothetical protein